MTSQKTSIPGRSAWACLLVVGALAASLVQASTARAEFSAGLFVGLAFGALNGEDTDGNGILFTPSLESDETAVPLVSDGRILDSEAFEVRGEARTVTVFTVMEGLYVSVKKDGEPAVVSELLPPGTFLYDEAVTTGGIYWIGSSFFTFTWGEDIGGSNATRRVPFEVDDFDLEAERTAPPDIIEFNSGAAASSTFAAVGGQSFAPSVAMDGKMTFLNRSAPGEGSDVWVAEEDGSQAKKLTSDGPSAFNVSPTISPDGSLIAWGKAIDGRIWVMNADGSDPRPVTDGPNDVRPQITPDNEKIVFEGQGAESQEIFVANLDGTERSQLTDNDYPDERPKVVTLVSREDDGGSTAPCDKAKKKKKKKAKAKVKKAKKKAKKATGKKAKKAKMKLKKAKKKLKKAKKAKKSACA